MQIQNNYPYYNALSVQTSAKPAFKGANPLETIKHCNIGMMPDGIIGKIKVFDKLGRDAYLNVVKIKCASGQETYRIQDNIGRLVGEMDIEIRKIHDFNSQGNTGDPSHVFIQLLRNYSNPDTDYYRQGLNQYKEIGTRLAQIAQRRSDEALCQGNIEAHVKNGAMRFYEKLGFVPQTASMCGYEGNKTRVYLPPAAKEPLSRRSGGL